jgi:hypothetical protein
MPPKKPDDRDSLARTVDRLLKKLPGADPTLQSDPDAPAPSAARSAAGGIRLGGTGSTGPRPALSRPPFAPRPTPAQLWGLWGRAAAGIVLGVALTQWPYRSTCGWPLLGYLAAVLVLLLVAAWAAIAAWKLRVPAAHVLGLVVGFWAIVLAAEQVLPRVGYAAETATWRCGAARSGEQAVGRSTSPAAAAPSMDSAPESAPAGPPGHR